MARLALDTRCRAAGRFAILATATAGWTSIKQIGAPVFFDDVAGLVRLLVVGPLAYVWLVAVLRVSGKRTLSQLNAFDFIVTVALGSTLATVALNRSVTWSEGAVALGLLAALQFIVAWSSVRVPWFRRAVTSGATVLLRDGQPLHDALARERISVHSLRQAVRSSGLGGLELVASVILEPNGTLSVIPTSAIGSGSALVLDDSGE